MNENNLFDNIARTLASPIPRRQAFGRILRGLAAATLASGFGIQTAWAITCPPGQPPCGAVCCPKGWICCNSAVSLCCNPSTTCDGKKCKPKPSKSHLRSTGV
jgi:hypothetical protein